MTRSFIKPGVRTRSVPALALLAGLSVLATACTSAPEPQTPAYRALIVTETACFGFCPDYTITITPDDHYVLEARRFTRTTGQSEGALPAGSFDQMMAVLAREEFSGLPPEIVSGNDETCPRWHTDAPSVTLAADSASGPVAVDWYRGCSGHPAIERVARIVEDLRPLYQFDDLIAPERADAE